MKNLNLFYCFVQYMCITCVLHVCSHVVLMPSGKDITFKRCVQTFDCECASLIPNRESMQLQQQLTDVNKQPFHELSTHVDWKSKSGAVTGLGTRPVQPSIAHTFVAVRLALTPVGRSVPPSPPQSQSVHQTTSTARTPGEAEMHKAEASKPFGLSLADLRRPDYAQSGGDFPLATKAFVILLMMSARHLHHHHLARVVGKKA